jgi:hypothetical protein
MDPGAALDLMRAHACADVRSTVLSVAVRLYAFAYRAIELASGAASMSRLRLAGPGFTAGNGFIALPNCGTSLGIDATAVKAFPGGSHSLPTPEWAKWCTT